MTDSIQNALADGDPDQLQMILELIAELNNRATKSPALSSFMTRVYSSIHAELLTARRTVGSLRILDVLNRVNSEIPNAIDYENRRHLLNAIAEAVLELTRADVVVLYEVPEAGERLKARPGIAGEIYLRDLMLTEVDTGNTVHTLLRRKEPEFIEKTEAEHLLSGPHPSSVSHGTERFAVREKVRSTMISPLFFGDSPVGLLFVNFREPQTFDVDRKRDFAEISRHIALALYNMRSYRRTIELNDGLAKLFDIAKEITSHGSDRQSILDTAIRGMVTLIETPRGAIVEWDPNSLNGRVVAEFHEPNATALHGLPIPKESELQSKILQGQICIVENVEENEEIDDRARDIMLSAGIKSALLVPIMDDQQRVIASIGIDETRNYRKFLAKDITLCKILAGQVATALKLAATSNEIKRRAELLVLQQRAMTLIMEKNDPDPAFQLIVEEGLKLIGATNGQLLRLNHEKKFLETDYSSNEKEIGLRYPVDESVTGQAVVKEIPILIRNLDEDPEANQIYKRGYEEGMKSELAVPLIDNLKGVIGVLNAESPMPDAFTPEHQEIWKLLAENVTKVIQLAQIVSEKNAFTSLSGIQQRILEMPSPALSDILTEVLDVALQFADIEDSGIGQFLLFEPETKNLKIVQSSLEGDVGQELNINVCISGIAVNRRSNVRIGNLDEEQDPELGPYRKLHQWFGNDMMHSELVVPLLFSGEVIGVINLEAPTTYAFTELHERLVGALASRAAIIIQQTRLLERERSLAERELRNRLEEQQTRDLSNILHRLNNPLGAIRQYALLAEESLHEEVPNLGSVRKDLANILESANKTAQLASDMRSQLRNTEIQRIDLNQQVQRAVHIWRQELDEKRRGEVEIVLDLADHLPSVRCTDKFGHVIQDLLNNAFEATPTDRICQIKIQTAKLGDRVEVLVSDNGIGMERNLWEIIFDETFHTIKPRRDDTLGGIGLWWDRRYLQSYGGDIVVASSEIGAGTTMSVTLLTWEN